MSLEQALNLLRQNRQRYLRWLEDFLRIPSISTDEAYQAEMRRAVEWLARRLRLDLDAQVTLWETPRHPALYGYIPGPPDGPTVLLYGHYDVQPPGSNETWRSLPFEPVVMGDYIYARGAADMKAQIVALMAAVHALLLSEGQPPLTIKFLLEGEEEIGSPSLPQLLREHAQDLQADVCLNPDAGMLGPDMPTVMYGLRGIALFELRVYGPNQELHSGMYGGPVPNPIQAAFHVLGQMHDDQGRITLPGFYDDVVQPTEEERRLLARMPFPTEDEAREKWGILGFAGEPGFTPLERSTIRPTLEFHGVLGGYIGKGSKTIIPREITVKFSCRLVPNQRPEKVHEQVRAFLEARMPQHVRWELDYLGGALPVQVPLDTPEVQTLQRALQDTWHKEPYLARNGGTIPAVAYLQEMAGISSVLTGFALPDSNLHGPNERQHLPTWEKGMEAILRFLYYYSNGR